MSAAKHMRLRAIALLTSVGLTTTISARATDAPWTLHDVDTVADAAMATLSVMKQASVAAKLKNIDIGQAAYMVRLSEALTKAGHLVRAKDVLSKARAILGPADDATSSIVRQNIVRNLLILGDETGAEELTHVDTALPAKASLLGEFGRGQAERGNVVGAQKTLAAIVALGTSSDPALSGSLTEAQRTIAVALVKAGAVDDAVKIADGLNDKSAVAVILARSATALCRADDAVKGRALAKRAADDAVAVAATVDMPYKMFEPIQDAAEAMTACHGVPAAVTFVREAIPPHIKEEARTALIGRFSRSGQAAVAVAVAPPPKTDDGAAFLDLSYWLDNNGDLAAAKDAATRASQIAIEKSATQPAQYRYELDKTVHVLANLGGYDAAIAAIDPLPVAQRAPYYMMLVDAAIKHKDSAGLALVLPETIAALNSTAPNLQAVTRFQLAQNLVNGGYSKEAQPLAEALLAPSKDSAAPKNPVLAIEAAKLRADMGDIDGALQTAKAIGAMAGPPGQSLAGALTVIQFDGRTSRPSGDEVKAGMERAKAVLPAQISGSAAQALSQIAMSLAYHGNIAGALKAESELEVEPRGVLAGPRDAALGEIANAQARVGDLRTALSTTLRITQEFPRWESLLKLAAKPPTI